MRSGHRYIRDCQGAKGKAFFLVYPFLLAILLNFSRSVTPARADELLILQSGDLQPYHQAAEGLLSSLGSLGNRQGTKAMLPFTVDKVVLDKEADDDGWSKTLRQRRLSAVVAIGKRALQIAVQLPDVPVIHVMVPGAEQIIGDRENVAGISMVVPPAVTLENLQIHYPRVHRIVVLYHPVYSDKFIREAEIAAHQLGLELVAVPTDSPQEVDRLLNSVQEKVQALWMIADPNVLNAQTTQTFLDYSIKKRVLLITFAEKYLKTGATFGVATDSTEMGRQAGSKVAALFEGQERSHEPPKKTAAYCIFKNTELLDRIATLDVPAGRYLP